MMFNFSIPVYRPYKYILLTGFFLGMLCHPTVQANEATELIKQADALIRGQTNRATFTMIIERSDWSRSISMKSWSKGFDFSLIYLTKPARDKGNVFLKRYNEIWNWVPSIERVIKIPPSMMMQSWMGSDFTNDDLIKESSIVHDYTHRIVGEDRIEDEHCVIIELIPKEEAAVVWGKILTWVSKDHIYQLRAEYYDEEGELINHLFMSDIKDLGGRRMPARMEMIPEDEPGNKTILIYEDIIFDEPMEESFFSRQQMKRIR